MILNHGETGPPILGECYSILPDRVRKLLGFVQSTLKWRLMDRKPLDKWTHESGRVTLLGDACHPMLVGCTADWIYSWASPLIFVQSHIERKVLQQRSKTGQYSATSFREFLTFLN